MPTIKQSLKFLFLFLILPFIIFSFEPGPKYAGFDSKMEDKEYALSMQDSLINPKEYSIYDPKPDNMARIVWYDKSTSLKDRTKF